MTKELKQEVPTLFQVMNSYEHEDSRFLKVKIWLMHVGENMNNSYFPKEVVEKAIPSLSNTPIMATVIEEFGEKDFHDHNVEIKEEDGRTYFDYKGQAIGVIPETNNYKFEKRVDDYGVEREYLTVEGLIWTKWRDPIKIFEQLNIKGQSMEISTDFTGEVNEEGVFVFEEFKFYGACILGDSVTPAMNGATIEAHFSKDKTEETIKNKLKEFYTNFQQGMEEKGTMKKDKKEQEVENTKEELKDKESTKKEDKETPKEQEKTTPKEETKKEESPEEKTPSKEEKTEDKPAPTPAPKEEQEEKVNFELVAEGLKEENKSLKAYLEKLQVEVKELKDYKQKRLEGDLRAKFIGQLPEEQLNEIFSNKEYLSLEEVEKEIYATIGRLNFSKKQEQKEKTIKVTFNEDENKKEENPYGDLFS